MNEFEATLIDFFLESYKMGDKMPGHLSVFMFSAIYKYRIDEIETIINKVPMFEVISDALGVLATSLSLQESYQDTTILDTVAEFSIASMSAIWMQHRVALKELLNSVAMQKDSSPALIGACDFFLASFETLEEIEAVDNAKISLEAASMVEYVKPFGGWSYPN